MAKMPPAIALVMTLLLIMEFGICCSARNSTLGCIERERNALLKFKASFVDASNRLSSWNPENEDCCGWQGVECHGITGHVITLDLSYKLGILYITVIFSKKGYYSSVPINGNTLRSQTLDSSLLELKYLSYLDLSSNNFNHSKIPAFLGSMKHLHHLNLSNSNFVGVVPQHLGNLSSLRALDMKWNDGLIVDDLRWATNLSSLEYLDMSYANLSSTKDPFQVLNMLPSLRVLRLSGSGLSQAHLPNACLNSTLLANVWYLDLSHNSLDGGFPCFIQNMTRLSFLDLSDNMFSGSFNLLGLKNLAHLNLARSLIAYEIEWISKVMWDTCRLKSLDLSFNYFEGNISGLFTNLSGCWSRNLESLSLKENKLSGHIPTSLGELLVLKELDLYRNDLSGPIPLWLGNLRSLRVLDIGFNQLSGPIPVSLGQLSNLESIDISSNSFVGILSEAHFANLSKLKELSTGATYNMLRLEVGYDWVPPFQLKYLNMRSSKFGGPYPKWLQTQNALSFLHLSNCSIEGPLPQWLHSINLTDLDLSYNNITGPIPKLASTMEFLDLSNNMITHNLPNNIGQMMPLLENLVLAGNLINGTIPDSLCELRGLYTLDLSKNHLSGNLPDCWPNFPHLDVARLSFNELSGVIPNSIGGAYNLGWLHLNGNKLTGKLPSTLNNFTWLIVLDVGGNNLSGKLPEWIGKGQPDLMAFILRNNEFSGTIPSAYCQLLKLQVMDIARNKLTGNIPHCFGNLSGMTLQIDTNTYFSEWEKESLSQVIKGMELEYTTNSRLVVNLDLSSNNLIGEIPSGLTALSGLLGLNLSHNYLTGKIPAKIGDLKSLQSLDLSSNKLFGKIPDSLSNLSFLSHLNFSNNNLSGQIPTGNQLQTLNDPSIYEGNPQLCGAPLPKKCHNDIATKAPHVENHEDTSDKALFYVFIVAGSATGFWGFIGVLVLKVKWRQGSGSLKWQLRRWWDVKLLKDWENVSFSSVSHFMFYCIFA